MSTTTETLAREAPAAQATAARTITMPTRVFLMGSVRLADPAPALDPLQAMRLYTPNYPHLANATLSPPEVRGTELFYRIEKPPVTTKG